jgi:rhamnose transport system permease protein
MISKPHMVNAAKFRELGLLVFIVLLVGFIQLRNPRFLTSENLNDMIVNASILGALTVGMMMVMITGGIDLSIGAVIALSGMAAALVVRDIPTTSAVTALIIGTVTGCVCGFISGLIVAKGKVLALIATLGMMNVYRGLTYLIAKGAWVSAYQMNPGFEALALGKILGLNNLVWVALIIFIVAYYFLTYTRTGRRVYAVGSNVEAARISGIDVDRILIMVYTIMGTICGLCGVLWVSKYASAQGDTALGYEMTVIAACVIGGVSVSGGSGKVQGVFLGAVLLGVLKQALPMLKVSPFWQDAIYGFIILIAVVLNTYFKRTVDWDTLQRRKI